MKKLLIIIVLLIPGWSQLLHPGLYFMHDELHLFRLYEFDQCVQVYQFPCRWSANASLGYGQPLFNFYGQTPYWLGELFHLVGVSFVDSLKLLLGVSLVASGLGMYFLAKSYWSDRASVLVTILYVYAPYRAVNMWVRGALNECLALAIFPWLLLIFERTIKRPTPKNGVLLGFMMAFLLLTHNLSFLMFLPFLGVLFLVRIVRHSHQKTVIQTFLLSGLVAVFLSAFYWLPVLRESSFIHLDGLTSNYYNYQLHWVTLSQLFVSRFWGYGGSTWGPNDTMSLSVGHLQWLAPLFFILLLLFRKKKPSANFLLFLFFGIVAIFLTHGKSAFIWRLLPFMPYIQFPWRFLGLAVFYLSLAAGFSARLTPVLIVLALLLCAGFFQAREWRPYNDAAYFSAPSWAIAKTFAATDYWPGPKLPDHPDTGTVLSLTGDPIGQRVSQTASVQIFSLYAPAATRVIFPIGAFPGWHLYIDDHELSTGKSLDYGLITANIPASVTQASLVFKNTPVRTIGNLLSLFALMICGISLFL